MPWKLARYLYADNCRSFYFQIIIITVTTFYGTEIHLQESESSKLYAEQKEEEVKILEHSIEELESTINVLEKKVSCSHDLFAVSESLGRLLKVW